EAQFLLGLSRYYRGNFADAEKSFETVAGSVPLNEVYNDLGAAQSRGNRLPMAIMSFSKAVEGDSSDPDYHFNLGYALWKSGRFTEAAESFRAATRRNPQDTEATQFGGRCLKEEGPRAGDPKSEGRERI